MSKLIFQHSARQVPIGKTVPIELSVQHEFAHPLIGLRVRVRTGTGLRLMCPDLVQVGHLAPGQMFQATLLLHGLAAGPANVHLERINARLGGRAVDFPAHMITLHVVSAEHFDLQNLVMICEQPILKEAQSTKLALRLHNRSSLDCPALDLEIESGNLQPDPEDMYRTLEPLQAGGHHTLHLNLYPKAAGDQSLVLHLRPHGRLYPERQYKIPLDIQPGEQVAAGSGDSVTVVYNYYGDGSARPRENQSAQKVSIHMDMDDVVLPRRNQAVDDTPPMVEQVESTALICPHCGEQTARGKYCDRCGQALDIGSNNLTGEGRSG